MLQNSNLGEDNLTVLDIALKNLSKLERINRSILLLNMLDHNDVFDNSDIKLSEEIKNITEPAENQNTLAIILTFLLQTSFSSAVYFINDEECNFKSV